MRVRKPAPFRRTALAAAVAAAMALPAGAEAARLRPASFMPAGETVEPPYGYFDFCAREPADCAGGLPPASDGRASETTGQRYWDVVFTLRASPWARQAPVQEQSVAADLTPEQWRAISQINRQVNRDIYALSDSELFSRDDYWTLPQSQAGRRSGDCEDYVLEKRKELISLGLPAEALSIAIARTPRREVHAVLLLTTTQGDYVLDNRSAWISRWYETDYRWERRQVAGGQRWAKVGD